MRTIQTLEQQLAEKPHRIVRLEDTDGDGRYDRRTVFADRMMFPEGTMWLDGSLYMAAPPSIWKLTDADGDGVAERREEWFQGKTLTGYQSIRTDLKNAGATVVDEEVKVCQAKGWTLITSRTPDDLDAFVKAIDEA